MGASPLPNLGDRVRRHALPGGATACGARSRARAADPPTDPGEAALPRVVDIDGLVPGAHVTGEGDEHGEAPVAPLAAGRGGGFVP
ncbi:hypothetical protein ACFCWG_23720 [Streptomyces sp. NPDC056390]|uniref:hypothetical protein n=1 Tax=Streptomyces sp. NPDC056390 TaxID=3345806 RepID=UPI0035DFA35E